MVITRFILHEVNDLLLSADVRYVASGGPRILWQVGVGHNSEDAVTTTSTTTTTFVIS